MKSRATVDISRIHDRRRSSSLGQSRGRSITRFRRRFLSRTKLEHPKRLDHVVHLVLRTLSDLHRTQVASLCLKLCLSLSVLHSTSSFTSTSANSITPLSHLIMCRLRSLQRLQVLHCFHPQAFFAFCDCIPLCSLRPHPLPDFMFWIFPVFTVCLPLVHPAGSCAL